MSVLSYFISDFIITGKRAEKIENHHQVGDQYFQRKVKSQRLKIRRGQTV